MGGDVLAGQRLQASEPLRCCGRGGFDRGGFPAGRPEADVWSEPARVSRRFYSPLPCRAVICVHLLSSATLGTYRVWSGLGTSVGQGRGPTARFQAGHIPSCCITLRTSMGAGGR